MQKQEAINIIESTFNASFTEEQFTLFIKNLLNDIDTTRYNEYHGQYIKDAFKDHIKQYKRIGKYTDPNGDALDVLIVEVKDQTKLDKTRTSLRNFVISHLDSFEKDYALAAFYSKSDRGADWRFSFIKLEYKTEVKEGKLKQSKELTPAKRYSFLVGEHERAHTAKKQLLPLLENVYNNPTLEELEEAFSIEKVTDEFFEQYKALFLKLSEQFEADTNGLKEQLSEANIDIPRFTKKLLGQIVFLYFLQKKGWLGVPKDQKWGDGEKKYLQLLYNDAIETGKNFFGDYLQHLFYEALAHKHADEGISGYYQTLGCKVPFLNGGLFEADYDWENSNITIPNELFRNEEKVKKTGDVGTGVLDVFDRYNFTIKEDEPLEKEVAVDPEMLGKVFENMLEVTERKSKGAFYTPREIVHYMCQESLIHYLDNAVNSYAKTYQEFGSQQASLFGNEGKKGQQSMYEEHDKIIVPKEDIDTFIRKGFFALENDQRVLREGKETKTYKFQLPESVRLNADVLDEKLTEIKICDPAIGSGAFPVGLLHELVNAQLVLKQYLSDKYFEKKLKDLDVKKAEIEEQPDKYTYRLKRHTIQESIYGVDIDASAIDIARLRLWLSLVVDEEDLDNIEALPNLDYKIVCGNSLIGFPENWKSQSFSKLENLKKEFFQETNSDKKKVLKSQIDEQLKERLDSSEKVFGYKVDFDFKLFFSEVWHEKNGFDIVIGNPPYVNIYLIPEKEKKILSKLYSTAYKKYDLYVLFFEKGLNILSQNSTISLITSNKYFSQPYGYMLRDLFLKHKILEIVNFRYNVFKATVDTSITTVSKTKLYNESFDVLDVTSREGFHKLFSKERTNFQTSIVKDLSGREFRIELSKKDIPIIQRLKDKSIEFQEVCYVNYGCRLVAKDKSKKKADYIFKENKNGNFKRFIEGSDIRKFKIIDERYVDYKPDEHYLSLFTELFESSKLISKDVVGKDGISVAYDSEGLYNDHTTINAVLWHKLRKVNYKGVKSGISVAKIQNSEKYEYPFLLLMINSLISNYFFNKLFNIDLHFYPGTFQKMIIPNAFTCKQYEAISTLGKYLISELNSNNKLIQSYIEEISNAALMELYFPKEIKQAGKEILKHLGDLKPINDDMSDEEKLAIIQSEFERLYDPNHPVRNNVETLDSVEEVRIIKEALK